MDDGKLATRDSNGRFGGHGAFETTRPTPETGYTPLAVVDRQLTAGFATVATDLAAKKPGKGRIPAIVFRASPGAGKSTAARRSMAEDAGAWGRVAFHVPTLKLAEEAEADAQDLGLDTNVIRGRSATRPDGTGSMCAKADLVWRASQIGLSVGKHFCESQSEDGTLRRCPHFSTCAYHQQFGASEAAHAFLASAYVTLPDPGDRQYDRRVIDETFWREHVSIRDIPLVEFTAPRTYLASKKSDHHSDLLAAARQVAAALIAGKSPTALPFSADDLEKFARLEWQGRAPEPDIRPDQDDRSQKQALAKAEQNHRRISRLSAVWHMLADAKRAGAANCERLRLYVTDKGHVIRALRKRSVRHKEPTIILDADADSEILSALGYDITATHETILRPNAIVRQVHDRRMTTGSLLGQPGLRESWRRIIVREALNDQQDGGAGVLVGASRKVVKAFFEDAGHGPRFAGMSDDQISDYMLNTPLHGAHWLWFGGRALGSNRYKDLIRVVVIGREELPLHALEDQGRAIFGDTPGEPLHLLATSPDGIGLPEIEIPYEMTDGKRMAVMVPCHPDPRIRRLQIQARECATHQVIERLRLARAPSPKHVLIGCNMPIPGIPVDALVSWQDLCPARIDAAIADGLITHGAVRLSCDGLHKASPAVFASKGVVKDHIKHNGGKHLIERSLQAWGQRDGLQALSIRRDASHAREEQVICRAPMTRAIAERIFGKLRVFTE